MHSWQQLSPLCSRRLICPAIAIQLRSCQADMLGPKRVVLKAYRRSFRVTAALQTDIVNLLSSSFPSWIRNRFGLQASTSVSEQKMPSIDLSSQPKHSVREVHEVYENERYYGFSWGAPALLDRTGWTDGDGNPVVLEQQIKRDESDGWRVVVATDTDEEGWQYGTTFNHLQYSREGGRSSNRPTDLVRRRLWRRTAQHAAGHHAFVVKEKVDDDNGDTKQLPREERKRMRREAEAEAQQKAMDAFIGIVVDLVQRRQLWSILPWDPSAWLVMYWNHTERLKQLKEQNMKNAILTPDQPCAPSILHGVQGTLLQDMLCATYHARAAYGYAMLAGYLATVSQFLYMQTVQRLSFDAAGGASPAANNEAVCQLTGVQPDDIISARWKTATYKPCHYVAIDKAHRCIVVSIRGTLEVSDVLSDLSASPVKVRCGHHEGWVHEGMLAAAQHVMAEVEEPLRTAVARCPKWPVLITGHSLGAGVASILTLLLSDHSLPSSAGPLRCIAVAPAATMSKELAAVCHNSTTSIVLGSDVVARLSYASVEALLLEAVSSGIIRQAASRVGQTVMKTLMGGEKPEGKLEKASKKPGLLSVLSLSKDDQAVAGAVHAAQAALAQSQPEKSVAPRDTASTTSNQPVDAEQHDTSQPFGSGPASSSTTTSSSSSQSSSSLVSSIGSSFQSSEKDLADGNSWESGRQWLDGKTRDAGEKLSRSDKDGDVDSKDGNVDSKEGNLDSKEGGVEVLGQEHLEGRQTGERQAAAAQSRNDPQLLFPAGRIIWLLPMDEENIANKDNVLAEADKSAQDNSDGQRCLNESSGSDSEEDAAKKLRIVAVDASPDCFKEIFLIPDMINNHLPDNYLKALKQL